MQEVENGLKACETTPTIDLEQEMPPPAAPKPKKAPSPLKLEQASVTPWVKATPKMQPEKEKEKIREVLPAKEKEKNKEGEDETERKRPRYEYESTNLIKRKEIPKDQLYIKVGQEVWETLGPSSEERLLQERETSDRYYFCDQAGHRAYYCESMLALACKWGQLTGQKKIGGAERRQSLWCCSCAYNNTVAFMEKKEAFATRQDGSTIHETHATKEVTASWLKMSSCAECRKYS